MSTGDRIGFASTAVAFVVSAIATVLQIAASRKMQRARVDNWILWAFLMGASVGATASTPVLLSGILYFHYDSKLAVAVSIFLFIVAQSGNHLFARRYDRRS
jgi:nicotinamide riboside transporter PnuC